MSVGRLLTRDEAKSRIASSEWGKAEGPHHVQGWPRWWFSIVSPKQLAEAYAAETRRHLRWIERVLTLFILTGHGVRYEGKDGVQMIDAAALDAFLAREFQKEVEREFGPVPDTRL